MNQLVLHCRVEDRAQHAITTAYRCAAESGGVRLGHLPCVPLKDEHRVDFVQRNAVQRRQDAKPKVVGVLRAGAWSWRSGSQPRSRLLLKRGGRGVIGPGAPGH